MKALEARVSASSLTPGAVEAVLGLPAGCILENCPGWSVLGDVCRGGLCWAGAPETGWDMLQGKIQARGGEGGLYKRGREGSDGREV